MKTCNGGHSAGLTGEIRKPGAHIGAPGTMQFTTRTYAAASILERGTACCGTVMKGATPMS